MPALDRLLLHNSLLTGYLPPCQLDTSLKIVAGILEILPTLYPEVFVHPGFKIVADTLEILPTLCQNLFLHTGLTLEILATLYLELALDPGFEIQVGLYIWLIQVLENCNQIFQLSQIEGTK